LALGIRHGIDWDHIAAITDITSTAAAIDDEDESWLIGEPGVMLTDESHHSTHSHSHSQDDQGAPLVATGAALPSGVTGAATATLARPLSSVRVLTASLPPSQKQALWLGSLYAVGHGAVVVVLGVIAILAAEVLPGWIDPIMEKLVGATLLFLASYLFYSVYRYYHGGGQFHMRSRWMIVFAGVSNAWHWVRSHVGQHEHIHAEPQNYSSRTALGIGVIHGIGAETGTQALIIATAVGATSQGVAISALFVFVAGLLVSNTVITITSTFGFVSTRRRQTIYVMAGLVAAVFSLVLGLVFLTASTGVLPSLDPYFRWIGGPS
jgi:high-affinity nickel permease